MNGCYLTTVATAFSAAVISARWWPVLPQTSWQISLTVISLLTIVLLTAIYCNVKRLQKPLHICCAAIGGAFTGIYFALSVGQSYLNWQQLGGEIQQDVTIEGRIVSYQRYPEYHRMIVTDVMVDEVAWSNSWAIQLMYYYPTANYATGQWIKTNARIKPARAIANPHGFDMQRWYVSQRIVKTGYVRGKTMTLLLPDTSVRKVLQDRLIAMQLPGEKWLNALLFGDRQGFSLADWQTLQRTGTAHLFAISGLHLMIVAGMIVAMMKGSIAFFCLFSIRVPASVWLVTSVILLSCCGFYAYLAGWQTAVVRAYVMVAVVTILFALNSRQSRLFLISLTLAGSILADPLSVYGSALYLSIGAVAIIAWFHWWWTLRRGSLGSIQSVVMLQLLLSVLMAPLVAGLLGEVSLIAPVVNVIVVPVMSLLVIPLCLAGLLSMLLLPDVSAVASGLLWVSSRSLEWLISALRMIEQWCGDNVAQTVDVAVLIGLVPLIMLMLPPFRGRWYLLLVTLIAGSGGLATEPLADHSWQVHVFDVGQGSAALLSRKGEAVLVDTGAGFQSGFNFAEAVIAPFLTARELTLIRVVISHSDNDHAGGLAFIRKAFPDVTILTSHNDCVAGKSWRWQGLQLNVLWPPADQVSELSENNGSCVVSISDGRHSLLLPGDIEKAAEQKLSSLLDQQQRLDTSVLLAPHHGSLTSSSEQFVEKFSPEFVVFSQGWLNRWNFPHPAVKARYSSAGSQPLLISKTGYLRFEFNPDGIRYFAYRQEQDSPWYHKTFVNK